MKSFSSGLAFFSSVCSFLTLNFAISLPAQASISCLPATISKYPNGSLASCVLAHNTNVQVASPYTGTANFPCKAQNYILFNEQGQFQTCWLAVDIKIKQGNSTETCPADYQIKVAIASNGNLAIYCQDQ